MSHRTAASSDCNAAWFSQQQYTRRAAVGARLGCKAKCGAGGRADVPPLRRARPKRPTSRTRARAATLAARASLHEASAVQDRRELGEWASECVPCHRSSTNQKRCSAGWARACVYKAEAHRWPRGETRILPLLSLLLRGRCGSGRRQRQHGADPKTRKDDGRMCANGICPFRLAAVIRLFAPPRVGGRPARQAPLNIVSKKYGRILTSKRVTSSTATRCRDVPPMGRARREF